jgi:hypothetical protein
MDHKEDGETFVMAEVNTRNLVNLLHVWLALHQSFGVGIVVANKLSSNLQFCHFTI